MKKLHPFKTMLLAVSGIMIPVFIAAQHNHQAHGNSNELDAKPVNMEHSLYHMDATWENQRNETLLLSDFRGKPVIAVMYYGNCTQVCPILIRDAERIYKEVNKDVRRDVRILAVTFDPEHDTPKRLREYAREKNLNLPEWHFVTGRPADIRELAMLLGVDYTRKNDGHFAHSNLVTVLDGEGRIVHRLKGLYRPVEEAAARIEEYLNTRNRTGTVHNHH